MKRFYHTLEKSFNKYVYTFTTWGALFRVKFITERISAINVDNNHFNNQRDRIQCVLIYVLNYLQID